MTTHHHKVGDRIVEEHIPGLWRCGTVSAIKPDGGLSIRLDGWLLECDGWLISLPPDEIPPPGESLTNPVPAQQASYQSRRERRRNRKRSR